MKIPRKAKIILAILGVFALIGAWQYVTFLFKYAYSRGTRTGIVRKVSVKGPPYCKYLEGEMSLQGATMAQHQDIFTFTVDDDNDNNAIVQQLRQAEHDGKRVTLGYRQDKSLWWRCNHGGLAGEGELPDSQYYVTKVEQ